MEGPKAMFIFYVSFITVQYVLILYQMLAAAIFNVLDHNHNALLFSNTYSMSIVGGSLKPKHFVLPP